MSSQSSPKYLGSLSSLPIRVALQNETVFKSFSPVEMEQVISAKGRMLIPSPSFHFSGLDTNAEYRLSIRFDKVCQNKFVYTDNEWRSTKTLSGSPISSSMFHHPKNVRSGEYWMKEGAEFAPLLTNSFDYGANDKIAIDSGCRYELVLIVSEVLRDEHDFYSLVGTAEEYKFDCLQFMTTTRYKNKRVSDIKSSLNKFSGRDIKKSRKLDHSPTDGTKRGVKQMKIDVSTSDSSIVSTSNTSDCHFPIKSNQLKNASESCHNAKQVSFRPKIPSSIQNSLPRSADILQIPLSKNVPPMVNSWNNHFTPGWIVNPSAPITMVPASPYFFPPNYYCGISPNMMPVQNQLPYRNYQPTHANSQNFLP